MADIDDINAALRTAATAASKLEAERMRLESEVASYVSAGLEDDKYIAQLEAEIVTLKARIAELEGEPPIIVDPPVPPTPGAPDFSAYGFAHLMPAWRQHAKPTEADCDWVIDGAARLASSRRGLGNVMFTPEHGIAGECYKRSINAGHGPRVTLGVKGNAGPAWVGGFYDSSGGGSPADICRRGQDGTWANQDVQFVGLTPDAEVGLAWGGPFGFTARVVALSLGIVGRPNTHAVVQNKRCGEVIFDDFWILRPTSGAVDWHAGLHLANWTRLVLRGRKRRGRTPLEALPTFSGHVFYIKHSDVQGAETWVMDNDLTDGNQTGVQKRPGKDEAYLGLSGQDVTVYANNRSAGAGWTHATFGGGSVITHWSSPHARTFIVGNEITDARGGCLTLSGQPLYTGSAGGATVTNFDRNWYGTDGYPIGEVYIDGNVLENPRGDRHCVSLSNARHVYWGDKNRVNGRVVLQSEWISERPPVMPNARVTFVGDRTKVPSNLHKYDPVTRAERAMTAAEIDAIVQPAWPTPL